MKMLHKGTLIAFIIGCAVSVGAHLFFRRVVEKHVFAVVEGKITVKGYLEVEDSMRIGSLVQGIIKKMYVEENAIVEKGQVLVEIDDGKEDAEVRQGQAAWDRSKAKLTYIKSFFERQKALYADGHISEDAFEQVQRDLKIAEADVELTRGAYDKAQLEFDNKTIEAPDNGLIVQKVAREGETVALTAPATIIYIIAKDITQMMARLKIPESVVAQVKAGMWANITCRAYPDLAINAQIHDVSRAAVSEKGSIYYVATVQIDNKEMLFNPGMTLHAQIALGQQA